MSAFNLVTSTQVCSVCGQRVELRVQFKYGEEWQYEYRLGEKLGWGGNQRSKPGASKVVAEGTNELCPQCSTLSNDDYEVWVEKDVITRVRPASGEFAFTAADDTFIVVEP